jgi:stage II sporulation protein AA (anti-sigma F factor antagonist)
MGRFNEEPVLAEEAPVTDRPMRIERSQVSGAIVLTVDGELDILSSPMLRAALDEFGAGDHVVIDCSEVEFMDSTGLNLIVVHAKRLLEIGGSLRLRNASPAVRHVLELSGLIRLVESTNSANSPLTQRA